MKLLTRVSKRDNDSALQLGPHIFTVQRVYSQLPRLQRLAEPLFQGQTENPEQLEDWPKRESIPPSLGPLPCAPGTTRAPPLPTSIPRPSTARPAEEGSSSLPRGTGGCVCHAGMYQGPSAHPTCQSCPDTSSSLPAAGDPAALWLAVSPAAWSSPRSPAMSRAPGAAAAGTGRAWGSSTHLSRCEASLCAVGSVLCSCLRARSLANSPWQSCTPGREKQRVRPEHSPRADTFCTRPGLAAPGAGAGLCSPCSVRT